MRWGIPFTVWEELRRQLGTEFSYGPGHWFCVPHGDVRRSEGRPFSQKTGGSGRRVVLATRHGPNATLFARYRHDIPVVVKDGVELARGRIDEAALVALLRGSADRRG